MTGEDKPQNTAPAPRGFAAGGGQRRSAASLPHATEDLPLCCARAVGV